MSKMKLVGFVVVMSASLLKYTIHSLGTNIIHCYISRKSFKCHVEISQTDLRVQPNWHLQSCQRNCQSIATALLRCACIGLRQNSLPGAPLCGFTLTLWNITCSEGGVSLKSCTLKCTFTKRRNKKNPNKQTPPKPMGWYNQTANTNAIVTCPDWTKI